jgi:hypothetical protein
VFEVERGWVLCGTVRRQDGSPLRQALVMVEQGSSRTEWAYALSESDGTFSILGIAPAERARVRIASAVDVHSYGLPGFAELSSQEIKLEGERSNADFEVQVTSLELVVDFELPIWPSKELKEKWAPALAVWIDGNPADGPQSADLLFYCPDNMYATLVHRRDALIFRSDRYSICLEDMPPGKTITLAVGIEDLTQNDFDDPAAGCTYCTYRTTTVGRSPQPVHLRAYAPGTRESRVLAMGSAGLVVVVVCVLFLVRDARRRGKPGKP